MVRLTIYLPTQVRARNSCLLGKCEALIRCPKALVEFFVTDVIKWLLNAVIYLWPMGIFLYVSIQISTE